MNTIYDTKKECLCYECLKNSSVPPFLIDKFYSSTPTEARRYLLHQYYAKPLPKNDSWTKDWRSVTQRDYVFRLDLWRPNLPDFHPKGGFTDYTCRKWCRRHHSDDTLPPGTYSAQTMPDLFNEVQRGAYGPPRTCESSHRDDFVWHDDYRPHGNYKGWCLKGQPPDFDDCDR